MTVIERNQRKIAKSEWRFKMRKLYPNFNVKLWAKESYRISHPQLF